MKRLLLLSLLLFSFSQSLKCQFHWVNPKPQGNTLLGIDFPTPSTGYAAGECGTILKTTDGGSSWTMLSSGVIVDLNAICMIDSTGGFAAGDSGVVMHTVNGGNTWFRQDLAPGETFYTVCFITPLVGMTAGTNGTMLRTTDGGATWQQITTPVYAGIYDIDFPDNNIGYAVGGGGTSGGNGFILKSSDAGNSWQLVTDTLPQSLYSAAFTTPTLGYLAGNGGFMLKTTDGCLSYTVLPYPGPDYAHIRSVQFYNDTVGVTTDWSFHLRRTMDGGTTWTDLNCPAGNAICALSLQDNTSFCSVGFGGNMCLSHNRGDSISGFLKGPSEKLSQIIQAGTAIYALGEQMMIRSEDNGLTWETDTIPDLTYFNRASFVDALHGYALSFPGDFLATTDGGKHWTFLSLISLGSSMKDLIMTSLQSGFVCGGGMSLSGATWALLQRTFDGGHNWISMQVPSIYPLYKIVFPTLQKGFIAGANGTLLRTLDGGDTWIALPGLPNHDFVDISFPSADTGYLLGWNAFCQACILQTTNGGESWVEQSSLVPLMSNNHHEMQFVNDHTGFITGEKGKLFKTNDSGLSWQTFTPITSNFLYDLLMLRESGGYMVGGMSTILAYGDVVNSIPDEIRIPGIQAYPNPFEAELTVKLPEAVSGEIIVELSDLAGRSVGKSTLQMLPGEKSIRIMPPADVLAGFYLVKLITGSGTFMVKVIKGR